MTNHLYYVPGRIDSEKARMWVRKSQKKGLEVIVHKVQPEEEAGLIDGKKIKMLPYFETEGKLYQGWQEIESCPLLKLELNVRPAQNPYKNFLVEGSK